IVSLSLRTSEIFNVCKKGNEHGIIFCGLTLILLDLQSYPHSIIFSLPFFLRIQQPWGTGHQTAYLNTSSVYWPLRNNNNISEYYYKNRWTPQTAATATLPRLSTLDVANNYRKSSLWFKDRSYLSLRFAKLSYSLPSSLVKKVRMDDIEIIATG